MNAKEFCATQRLAEKAVKRLESKISPSMRAVVVIFDRDHMPDPKKAISFTAAASQDSPHLACAMDHFLYHVKGTPHAH